MQSQKYLRRLISRSAIQFRIKELGEAIRRDHGSKPLVCVAVLKSTMFFAADLMRAIGGDVRLEFLHTLNDQSGITGSALPRIQYLSGSLKEQNCILIDGIVDTGLTLQKLLQAVATQKPRSLCSVVLLDKPNNREISIQADYVGFSIPDEFVVGYGLDLQGRFQALDYIAAYAP